MTARRPVGHRLSGEDAGFLAMDLPGQPMNTMAVGTFRPVGRPVTRSDLRAHLEARLPQLPSFRWRIVRVPFGLHHPVGVDDPAFDLDFHLRTEHLGGAGGDADLEALFAAIAERHLDQRHPLWQATLVDGLADGRQALILKYHHCLADGVAAFTTFSRVFSDAERDPIPGVGPFAPGPLPTRRQLVADALRDHVAHLPDVLRLAARTRRRTAEAKARRDAAAVRVPDFSGAAPWCELNDAFTPGRAYVRAAIPLAGARRIKDRAGVTLNDVVLAVIAGAARRYLVERDGLPAAPLLASVPVSSERPDAPVRQWGNRFWSFTTSLATDVDDPAERLQVIAAVTREAKEQLALLGTDLIPAWLDRIPPLIADPGARALVERLRADREHADASILVSNIRGPEEPWQLFGTTIDDLHVDGPPSNGVGCNVMLWSYGDRLLFGILAFADALRDPEAMRTAIEEAYAELRDAVDASSAESAVLAEGRT